MSWDSELAEQMTTTGDVGLPTSMIKKRFPQVEAVSPFLQAFGGGGMWALLKGRMLNTFGFAQLQEALKGLPERWWYKDSANDVAEKRFCKSESKKELMVRCLLL